MTLNNPFKTELWQLIVLALITAYGYYVMIGDELSGWWLVVPAIPLMVFLFIKTFWK